MTEFSIPLTYQIIGNYKGYDQSLLIILKRFSGKLIASIPLVFLFALGLSGLTLLEGFKGNFIIQLILGLLVFISIVFVIPGLFFLFLNRYLPRFVKSVNSIFNSVFCFDEVYAESIQLTLNYYNENQIVIRKYIPSPHLGYYLHEQYGSKLLEYCIPYLNEGRENGIEYFTLKGDIIRLKVKSNSDFIEGIDINKIRFRIQGYNSTKARQELIAFLNNQIKSN